MPYPRSKSERARVAPITLCGLGLAVVGSVAATASVATATLSHFQVNPRTYDVHYDVQKRTYDGVSVSLNQNTMLPTRPVEYAINYGGTCEPGHVLDHSEIKLDIDQSWQANVHEYQPGINYISLANQRFGSNNTQNFRARDACNAALQQKLAQGQDLVQALKQPFTVWQVPFFQVQHTLFCRPPNSHNANAMETSYASATVSFDVSCGAATFPAPHRDPRPPTPSNQPRPGDLVHPFAVGAVSMAATQPNFQGPCPQEVTFNGAIRVSGNGRVTYQFFDSEGPVSPIQSVDFTNEAERIVTFKQRLPATAPVGGLAATPPPPRPPGPQLAPNTAPNVHSGFRVLRVLTPNRMQSAPAFYRVTCEARPAPTTLTAPTPLPPAPPPSAPVGIAALAHRPDLIIVMVQALPRDPLRLRVVVKNQGDAPAGAARLRLSYRHGGRTQTEEVAVAPLPPGAGRAVVVQAPGPLAAAESVVLRIDDLGQVAESNEDNNDFRHK
jgi:CARDB